MTLGEYIKKYREEHGKMSARAFASQCGLSVQYVLNLEKGRNNDGNPISPTVDTYLKIAKGTGVGEMELFAMLDDNADLNSALTQREQVVVKKFRALPEKRKRAVEAVLDGADVDIPTAKIIPLFVAAAGPGEPVADEGFDDYEVDADSDANFAVKISGDSMEPHLHDGEIVLCRRRKPEIGDLAVMMVNGFLVVKQFITDGLNIYLRSLNRERKNLDVDIWESGNDTVVGYGTVILKKKIPLVRE